MAPYYLLNYTILYHTTLLESRIGDSIFVSSQGSPGLDACSCTDRLIDWRASQPRLRGAEAGEEALILHAACISTRRYECVYKKYVHVHIYIYTDMHIRIYLSIHLSI